MAGPVFSLLFVCMITSHFKDAWSQHLSLPRSFQQQITSQHQFHGPGQTQFHRQGQGQFQRQDQGQFQRQDQGQFHSQGQREFHGQSLTGPTNPVVSPYDAIHQGSLRQPGMGQDTGVRNPPLNQFHPQDRPSFSNQVNKPTPPDPRPWFAPDMHTSGGFMDTGPQGQFQGNTGGGGRSPQRQNRNMNMAFHSDRRLVDSHQFVSQNHGRRGNQPHDIASFNQNAALSGSHVISSQSNVAHVDQPFMSPMSGRHMNREAQHSQRQRNGRVNEWQRRRPPSSSSSDIWNAFQNHKESVSSMKDAFVLDPSVYDKPQQQMPGNGMDQPLGMHSEGRSLTLSDYMGLGQPQGNVALAKDKKSPSVVDPRFAVISSPDQIATMDVSSSLAMHLHQPKRLGPFSRQRQNIQKQQPRRRNFQQERYHQNALNKATPPPKYYDGQPIGYVFDPFVVSGGSDVSLNTEVKVRTALSPVAKPTEKPPTVQPDLVPEKWDQKANMLTTGISSKNPEVEKTAGNSRTHQIYTGKQNAIGDVIHSPQNVKQSETQLVGEKPLATQNELPSTIPEKSNAVSNLNNKAGGDKAASASNHITTSEQSYWNSINSGIVRISTADKTNKGQSMTTTQSIEGINQNKLSTPAPITTTMRDLTKTEPKQVFAQAGTLMQEALNRESTTKLTNTEKQVKLDRSIKTVAIASTTVQPKAQLTTQSTQAKDAFNAMNSHKYEKLIASKEPSYPRPTVVQPMYSPVTDPKIEGKIYNVMGIKKTEKTRNSQNTTVIGNQPDNARTTKKDSVQTNEIKSPGIPVSFGGSWTSSPKTSGNEITTKRVEITTDTFTTTTVSTKSTTEAIRIQTPGKVIKLTTEPVVQQTIEATTKQTTEKVADPTTHFIRESTPATTKKVANLVVKETEQPTTEAMVLTTTPAKATTQPTTETTAQPTTKPTTEPTTEATTTPTTEATTTPTTEATTKPTTEPTTKPTTEPTTKPTTEPTTKPTTEPTTKPTTEPTTKPTTEPTTKPTTEATTKPTTEATTKPTTEATTKPTTEPTTKPTTEATTTVTTTEPTVKTTIKLTTKQTIRTTESPTTEATTKTTEAITPPAAELGNDPQATYPMLPTAKQASRFAQPLANAANAMVQTEPYLRNTLINQESKVPAVKSEVIESTTESAKIPIEELTTKSPVKQTTVQTPKPTTQLMTSTTTSTTKMTRPTTIARSVAHIERASSAFGDYMKPDIKATTQASIASNWRGSFVPLDPAQHVQELHKEQKGAPIIDGPLNNNPVISQVTPSRPLNAVEPPNPTFDAGTNVQKLGVSSGQGMTETFGSANMQGFHRQLIHQEPQPQVIQKTDPSPVANNPSNPSGMIKDNNPSVANTGLVAVPSTVNQEVPNKPLATNPNAIPAHAWQTQANTNMAAAGNQFVPSSPLTSSTGGNEPVASGQPSNSQILQAPPLDAQQPGSMAPKPAPKQFTFPGMNRDVHIPGNIPVQPTEPLQSSAAAPLIDATVEKVKTQPLNKNVHAPTDFNTGLNTFNNQPLNNLQNQQSAPVHANTGVHKHGNNALPEYAGGQTGTAVQTSNVEPLFSNSNQQGPVGGSNSNPQQPVFNYIPPNGTPPPSSTIAVQVDPYINVQDQLSTNNPNTVNQMSGMIISAGNGQYPMESIPPGQYGTASMLGMAASVTPSSVSTPSVGSGYIGTESVVYPTNPVTADLLTTTVAATTTQSPQPSSAASERRQMMIDALVRELNNLQKRKPLSQQRVITAAKLSTLRDDALIRLSTKLGLPIPTIAAAITTPKPTIRTPSRRRGRTRSRLRSRPRTRSRGNRNRGTFRIRG